VSPGICGFTATSQVQTDGSHCRVSVESECASIQSLASRLDQVDPLGEVSFRGEGPSILRLAAEHCPHAACPVPVAIIKAIEVEAGLALPADVSIKLTRS